MDALWWPVCCGVQRHKHIHSDSLRVQRWNRINNASFFVFSCLVTVGGKCPCLEYITSARTSKTFTCWWFGEKKVPVLFLTKLIHWLLLLCHCRYNRLVNVSGLAVRMRKLHYVQISTSNFIETGWIILAGPWYQLIFSQKSLGIFDENAEREEQRHISVIETHYSILCKQY